MTDDIDPRVRARAFGFLTEQVALRGEVLPWAILSRGFTFDGVRVPLIGPQGIFKPAVLPEMPLSIATAPVREGEARPYSDGLDESGLLNYRYRGTDPNHRDNVGLRRAMRKKVPLIYLFGVVKGEYMPVWPVHVVGDDPGALTFKVEMDQGRLASDSPAAGQVGDIRRSYTAVITLQRVHQQIFRERVLRAYGESCAVCRLRHRELLDAAHILPDNDPRGEPVVPNGVERYELFRKAG